MKCKNGFKEVAGRCVRVTKKFRRSGSKSYNPFKMWGTYVFPILITLIYILTATTGGGLDNPLAVVLFFLVSPALIIMGFLRIMLMGAIFMVPSLILYSAIVGYSIHASFRRSKVFGWVALLLYLIISIAGGSFIINNLLRW